MLQPARESAGAGSFGGRQPSPGLAWRTELTLVVAAAICLTVSVALAMGRDLNWDFLNYHAYAAELVRVDRLSQDYFPAGLQGYLNPLPYLPMAVMQALGWPSPVIAGVTAAIQSLNLVFLYLISRELLAAAAPRRLVVLAAPVLGGATATLWTQVGSSFVDATLAPLVLGALWLLLRQPGWFGLAFVGLLAGASPGLKWTLVPYGVALCVAAAGLPGGARLRLQRLTLVGAAAAAGFLITYAPWGWRLYQEFGSPVFPLFNTLFQAADYPLQSDEYRRFVPDDWAALLTFPFRMAQHGGWVYTEVGSPDLRPALVVVLGAASIGIFLAARIRARRTPGGPASGAAPDEAAAPQSRGRLWVLGIFFAVSLLLWLKTSSNGRYAAPTFLLLGPITWLLCEHVAGVRAGRTLGLLVVCLQLVHVSHASGFRWNGQPWSRQMLAVELPRSLVDRPVLLVSVGMPSESYLATRMHPQSAFTNPIGFYSVPTGGPGWGRLVALRDRWAGRTHVLFKTGIKGELVSAAHFRAIDDLIDRLGLSLVPGSREAILVNAEAGDKRRLAACAARPRPEPDAELAERRELVRRITSALQARCPRYLQPPAPQVEGLREEWSRRYVRHDLLVHVNFPEDYIGFRQENQGLAVPIGRVSTWERDVENFVCRLPHGGRRDASTLRQEGH
ncbi:MAG: hypothetical protein ACKO5J_02165 [Rubrivivax sp.]